MARKKKSGQRLHLHTDSYWQQIVENRIPLVGAWFREIAAIRLAESARKGSEQAAQSLARALDSNPADRVREIAREALAEIGPGCVWNAVWEVWLNTRSGHLERLLRERNLSATHPPEARAYSHLLLGKDDLLLKAGPEVVPALNEAGSAPDRDLAKRAQHVLANMTHPASRAAFYELWASQRKPWQNEIVDRAGDVPQSLPLRVLVLLRRERYEDLIDDEPEAVEHLVRACGDADERIARSADLALRLLRNEGALDELCHLWAEGRSPLLEEIITQKGVIAGQPADIRIRTALLLGRLDIVRRTPPQHLDALLSAAADRDERIATRAQQALAALDHLETREALCERVIERDDPIAWQAANQGGYLPATSDRRALFLLLTGQWDACAALDFDQRMLRTVFSAASPPLRQRITHAVQSAGRIDFLRILTGAHDQGRPIDWREDEVRLLVGMLARERQWDRLWKLCFDVPLAWSIDIVRILSNNDWQPQPADEALFRRLSELSAALPAVSQSQSLLRLPIALRAETIRVSGRVNAIAFSPTAPLLAIGTGQRQVVLWNYRRGEIETVVRGFEHSISRVAFMPGGRLVAAERANPDGPCRLVLFDGSQSVQVGGHDRSITDLCPLDEDRLLSAGNDQRIVLWDLATGRSLAAATLPRRAPRAHRLVVSPDRQHVYTIHERIGILALPELDRYREFYATRSSDRAIQRSTGRCAALLPPDDDLVVGQHNGQVIWHRSLPHRTHRVKHLLTTHERPVQEVTFVSGRSLLASAGGEGTVRFIHWPGRESEASLQASERGLTAMEISGDESFLATGSRDSSITLWDMRTDRLAEIMEKPLAAAQPADLSLVNAFAAAESGLSRETAHALQYLQLILQHRLRFDIVVADLPAIRPGAFDIQLGEVAPKTG